MKLADSLKFFRWSWGAATAAVLAGPLGIWAGGIDPPDPPGLAVTVATPFCVVVLLLCMHWGARMSAGVRRWFATGLLIAGLIILVWYLAAYFGSVVHQSKNTPDGIQTVRVITGSQLREGMDARNRTSTDLLLDYGFDPKRIWTPESLLQTQLRLHGLFTISFMLLTSGVAILAVRETSRKGETPKSG
jgi:hypothetical protein